MCWHANFSMHSVDFLVLISGMLIWFVGLLIFQCFRLDFHEISWLQSWLPGFKIWNAIFSMLSIMSWLIFYRKVGMPFWIVGLPISQTLRLIAWLLKSGLPVLRIGMLLYELVCRTSMLGYRFCIQLATFSLAYQFMDLRCYFFLTLGRLLAGSCSDFLVYWFYCLGLQISSLGHLNSEIRQLDFHLGWPDSLAKLAKYCCCSLSSLFHNGHTMTIFFFLVINRCVE